MIGHANNHAILREVLRNHTVFAEKTMEIVLYYSPGACSFAPHVVLNEIGLPFELRKFSTKNRENYSEEYLAINPKGRIPALWIDQFLLTENPAILTYLGRRFPSANLYPSDASKEEARCLEWLAWCSNTVHVAYAQILRPERFVQSEENYSVVRESGHANYQEYLSTIDEHLKNNQHALVSGFSVVDPFWLVFYRWGVLQGYDMKKKFLNYSRYVDRLAQRNSVIKALETEGISIDS